MIYRYKYKMHGHLCMGTTSNLTNQALGFTRYLLPLPPPRNRKHKPPLLTSSPIFQVRLPPPPPPPDTVRQAHSHRNNSRRQVQAGATRRRRSHGAARSAPPPPPPPPPPLAQRAHEIMKAPISMARDRRRPGSHGRDGEPLLSLRARPGGAPPGPDLPGPGARWSEPDTQPAGLHTRHQRCSGPNHKHG